MIPRERLIEIAVSAAGVGTMIALLYAIGLSETTETNGHQVLTSTGGEYIVYAIIAFIVLMTLAGIVLIRTVTVVEADTDEGDTDGDSSGA